MKRSTRIRSGYQEHEETPAKKHNPGDDLQDEIVFEPEDEEIDPTNSELQKANVRRIKIVRDANFGYKPRVVPPWASRFRHRYLEQAEYYMPRIESEITGDDGGYAHAELDPNGSGTVIITDIKRDLDQDEHDVNSLIKSELLQKPKRGRPRKNRNANDVVQVTEGDEIAETNHQVVINDSVENPLYAYAVVDGDVQDTIVVDDDNQEDAPVRYDIYQHQVYPEDVTSIYLVGSELVKNPWDSNEEIQNFFLANPHLNYPVDVRELAALAKNASPEVNYQLITGLGAMVSCLKKEIGSMKSEMVGLREMVSSKQDMGNTKRRFSTMNDVRHPWKIQAMPPLREVDLVNTARTIDYTRGAKKQLSNKDGITRFVKTCLELLIPEEFARLYTVRDRSHRKNGLKDIGDHAKEQITGCVLDLLGLFDIDELDDEGRADRAYFTNIVSHAMRMALIDLRRSEPRRILGSHSNVSTTENSWP